MTTAHMAQSNLNAFREHSFKNDVLQDASVDSLPSPPVTPERKPGPSTANTSSISGTAKPPTNSLASFVNEDAERLLKFVDGIKTNQGLISHKFSTPEIVVCGKTSCGKSSLLQSLTRLPFPVNGDICTTFRTKIVMHRANANEEQSYSIKKQSEKGNDISIEILFKHSCADSEELEEKLANDFSAAFKKMGTPAVMSDPSTSSGSSTTKKVQLSRDCLIVSVTKRDQSQFSIMDLPGFVKNAHDEDVSLAQELARSHISCEKTFTLAVIDATDSIVNQEVLRLVEDCGATGRTVGVLTKVDKADIGRSMQIDDFLQNRIKPSLPLGCYAVRNLTPEERNRSCTEAYRSTEETRFFLDIFPERLKISIKPSQFGVANLRDRLAGILYDQVSGDFENLLEALKNGKNSCENELKFLGNARDTTPKQRIYLHTIQREYWGAATSLLTASTDRAIVELDVRELLRSVRDLSDEFAAKIGDSVVKEQFDTKYEVLRRKQTAEGRTTSDFPHQIYESIKVEWDMAKGSEEKYDNPLWLKRNLFIQHSLTWPRDAKAYVDKVMQIIDKYNKHLFSLVCPDKRIRYRLQEDLRPAEASAIRYAEKELDAIISDRDRQPRTYNYEFDQFLRDITDRRKKNWSEAEAYFVEENIDSEQFEIRGEDYRVFELHDWLYAYLSVAMPRYIDNVILQVVERHLLGPKGPLRVFTPEFVDNLSVEDLEDMAGEDERMRSKRVDLTKQIAAFDDAIKEGRSLLVGSFMRG